MARKSKGNKKWQEIKREEFDSHTVSLGDLLKDLAAKNPDLVIEGTGHKEPRSNLDDVFVDGRNKVTLWHGNPRSRGIVEKTDILLLAMLAYRVQAIRQWFPFFHLRTVTPAAQARVSLSMQRLRTVTEM